MLNNKLQEYLELHSKYVDLSVRLHNYHYAYVKHQGYESSIKVRSTIRKMIAIQRAMRKTCLAAYKEHKNLEKEKRQQEKVDKEARKLARLQKKEKVNEQNI